MWQNWSNALTYSQHVFNHVDADSECNWFYEVTENDYERTTCPEFTANTAGVSGTWTRGAFGGPEPDKVLEYFYLRVVLLGSATGSTEELVVWEMPLYLDIDNPCLRTASIMS